MRKSIINKYGSSLGFFANGLNVLNFLLSFFGIIPQEIKSNDIFKLFSIILLVIGGILLIRFLGTLLKQKSLGVKFLWYAFAVSFFAIMTTSTILQRNTQSTKETTLVNSKNVINEQTQNSNINRVEVKSDSAKSIHIVNGRGNVVGVNGNVTYITNKPISRKLNRNDVKLILSSIPSKDFLVRVGYPANNQEAINFRKQIIDTLFQLGYSNISEGDVSNSHEYFASERITIKKDSSPVPATRLIINPQQ